MKTHRIINKLSRYIDSVRCSRRIMRRKYTTIEKSAKKRRPRRWKKQWQPHYHSRQCLSTTLNIFFCWKQQSKEGFWTAMFINVVLSMVYQCGRLIVSLWCACSYCSSRTKPVFFFNYIIHIHSKADNLLKLNKQN